MDCIDNTIKKMTSCMKSKPKNTQQEEGVEQLIGEIN